MTIVHAATSWPFYFVVLRLFPVPTVRPSLAIVCTKQPEAARVSKNQAMRAAGVGLCHAAAPEGGRPACCLPFLLAL